MIYETHSILAAFPQLIHAFSTRLGGVSQPPHATLNLGYSRPDDPAAVAENRRRLAEAVGFQLDDAVLAGQIHGTTVAPVTHGERGRGVFDLDTVLPPADAMITNEQHVVLWANFGDCTPMVFFDPVCNAVGVAHAGWIGTVDNIAGATVRAMQTHYGCDPTHIIAVIGPSIGPCCYEVDEPVISRVQIAFADSASTMLIRQIGQTRPHFDLWTANRHWLQQAGLQDHNIHQMNICTSCHVERFFSHRKEHGATGRFAAIIGLREPHNEC